MKKNRRAGIFIIAMAILGFIALNTGIYYWKLNYWENFLFSAGNLVIFSGFIVWYLYTRIKEKASC